MGALRPTYGWGHRAGTSGSLQEAVAAAPWGRAANPEAWMPVEQSVRDGHTETWWALEMEAGPYGPRSRSG